MSLKNIERTLTCPINDMRSHWMVFFFKGEIPHSLIHYFNQVLSNRNTFALLFLRFREQTNRWAGQKHGDQLKVLTNIQGTDNTNS